MLLGSKVYFCLGVFSYLVYFYFKLAFMSSPVDSSSPPGTQVRGYLGVGAEVSVKCRRDSPLSSLFGLVMQSSPGSCWVVYWYDLDKTSCSSYNQLVVVSNASQETILQVGKLSKVLEKPVAFSTDKELKDYVTEVGFGLKMKVKKVKTTPPRSRSKSAPAESPASKFSSAAKNSAAKSASKKTPVLSSAPPASSGSSCSLLKSPHQQRKEAAAVQKAIQSEGEYSERFLL